MKFVVCTLLAVLAAAAAQSFDPTLPAQILVQTVAAGTTGGGQATTTTTNVAYGYDNATAAVDGGIFYNNQSSTSPSYSTIADPCNASYSNDTGCDTNAVCVSNTTAYPSAYQCVCNSGYNDTTDATTGVVSPSTFTQSGLTCTDVDQCSNATAACGTGVDQCIDGLGVYTCNCTSGYNLTNNYCYDEDECSAGTDNCDTNAACANTEGTFTCTCNSGYSGNGTTCTDVDECSNSTLNTCDANATCNNTVGSYDCTCNSGYSGNGTSCTDVDECTLGTDTCDSSANCTNTVGSYTCTCQTGYTGNGTSCVDEDECTANTDNCDANATCTNTVGSFSCACDSGYTGDGVNCTDIDECATSSPCVTNATCTNSVGSYSCACDSGFIGDGSNVCIVTEALNYCYRAVITLNNTAAVSTQTNTEQVVKDLLDYYVLQDVTFYYAGVTVTEEVAINANGEIIAEFCFTNMTKSADELTQSMSTYSSHGILYNALYSVVIADYDECANNYDSNCYDFNSANSETAFYSATCGNTNGTYTCACNSSLYDTYGNGSKCEDPYSYTCNGTYSTLSLVSSWFNGVGGNNWNVTFMAVNASECTGALSTDGTAYIFENCNANGTWQDNTTIYSPVRVYTDTTNLVYVTTSLIDFSYECTQDISQNVTVNFGQENDTANTVQDNNVAIQNIFAPDSTQSVDISITQYKSDFSAANLLTTGSTVTTGQLACLKLEVNNAAGVDVQFVKVETRAPGSSSFLDILTNGCTTTEATSYGISVDTSYGNGEMCFTMHRPSGSFSLEVDLTVNVCVGTCQTITCSTRRRRRREVADGTTREVDGYATVFKIDPNDQCDRNCGDGGCVMDFDNNQQCVCNTGAVKDATGYCATLVVDESGNPVNPASSSDNSTLYIIIGVAVGMLILVTILAGFFCFRRRQNAAYKQENYGYKQ